MASKPANTARWADVSGDIVEPASGKKDTGWVVDERPAAQYMNWLQNLAHQWFAYLNDGALSGDHSIAGHLTMGADKNVTVSGTGKFKRPAQRRLISLYHAQIDGSSATYDNDGEISYSGTEIIRIPVDVDVGERITGFGIHYDSVVAAGSIEAKLFRQVSTVGASSMTGSQVGSTLSGSLDSTVIKELISGALTEDPANGRAYFIEVSNTTNPPNSLTAAWIETAVV